MSRIGKLPIEVPANVEVTIENLNIVVKGPLGEIKKSFAGEIKLEKINNQVIVTPLSKTKLAKSMWGTARSIISSMVIGVNTGFKEILEVNGVGYRVALKGKYLNMTLGKSHNTKIEIPEGVIIKTPKQNVIELQSHNKEILGHCVAIIRNQRPPEPYKGKGIKKQGEYIQRKEGKKG